MRGRLKIITLLVACMMISTICSTGIARQQSLKNVKKQKGQSLSIRSGTTVEPSPIAIPRTFDGKNPHILRPRGKNPALDPGLGP